MRFWWVVITIFAAALAGGAGAAVAPSAPDAQARYGHTRCVLLARLNAPSELVPLATEVLRLRELGAPEIVVVIAGSGQWDGLSDEAQDALLRLKAETQQVRAEWNTAQDEPAWLRRLGEPVPSALLEAAYWQDRGYRLLPYGAPGARAAPKPPVPASQNERQTDKRKLRFSW